MKLLLINLFWISTLYFSCKSDVNTSCNDGEGLYIKARYPIGAAINFDALVSDLRYLNIAANQFNSVSPENILKAENIHPEENRFNWTQVDSLISFCERYNKRFYGHTLIWHNQLPQWILDFKGNTMQWEHLMKTHIQTIISHYKDKVIAWEVVNEAFNEDGTLRNSIWFENIGPSYIEKAFKYAKEANPNALLFYNDYNLES
ncbi:MAG: endo-1,4-beta-xylanase, partial [Bacteroidetes bacterium]|nr:endo-1,4-beta-xylanase [Bacteroidota bacterium]